jgi:flagellar assembly protein FliH
LSIAIARRILHRELTVDPSALQGLVKAAFDRLDRREIKEIRTDADSIASVKKIVEGLGAPGSVKVIADATLRPGSLVIEVPRGQLDASIETQLIEIERGFVDIVRHS